MKNCDREPDILCKIALEKVRIRCGASDGDVYKFVHNGPACVQRGEVAQLIIDVLEEHVPPVDLGRLSLDAEVGWIFDSPRRGCVPTPTMGDLGTPGIVYGRRSDCLDLPAQRISNRHFYVVPDGDDGALVHDLQSTNGIFICVKKAGEAFGPLEDRQLWFPNGADGHPLEETVRKFCGEFFPEGELRSFLPTSK